MDNPGLCVVLVIPKLTPHNHPMPPMVKVTYEAKAAYKQCIKALSLTGTTVQKVDLGTMFPYQIGLMLIVETIASTTQLILGGDPSQYHPALQDKCVKHTMVHELKLKKHPDGLGILGKSSLVIDVSYYT
jgi:hypothetical protein